MRGCATMRARALHGLRDLLPVPGGVLPRRASLGLHAKTLHHGPLGQSVSLDPRISGCSGTDQH